jgi:hypothetical protein
MRIFISVLILIFSLQSWSKADDNGKYITKKKKSSYITKKKQGNYITKKSKYITKKENRNKNYKFLLLVPFGFLII